jgi:hypothetical protein
MAHLQTFPETPLLTLRSNPQLGATDRNGFGVFLPGLEHDHIVEAFVIDAPATQGRRSVSR